MSAPRPRAHASLVLAVGLLLAAGWPAPLQAQLRETFARERGGVFPSRWTAATDAELPPGIVVTNSAGLPAGFQALLVGHAGRRADWGLRRFFDGLNLVAARTTEWGVRLNVLALPDTPRDSPGFYFYLRNQYTDLPFGSFRILTQDRGRRWSLMNPYYARNGGAGSVAKDLELNVWHDLRLIITARPGTPPTAQVDWYLNGKLVNTEQVAEVSPPATYADTIIIRPVVLSPPGGPVRMLVTDVYVGAKRASRNAAGAAGQAAP